MLTPTATREARTGTVDEGQKQSGCPAPLELRRQTAGAGAPCRSASWSPVGLAWDGGALLATVSATGACAVFEPPRCWADYAWATVDDVAAARNGADRLTLGEHGFNTPNDAAAFAWCPTTSDVDGARFGVAALARGASVVLRRYRRARAGRGPSAEFADEAKLRDGAASALAWSATHLFVGDVRGGVAKVGYRAEGGGLSLGAEDAVLRHPDERPVVAFAVGSGVLGVLAGARAELWTDRGCVILPVDDASCLAVLDDERVACGGAAGGVAVFGVDGAPKGPLFDGGDVVFGLAPSANGLCAAEIAAEEPDFAKRAEGFARLRVRALGARDAALGNADLRGASPADFLWVRQFAITAALAAAHGDGGDDAPARAAANARGLFRSGAWRGARRLPPGCEHALACGWGAEPRAPPDALRAPRVAAAAEATLAALRSARSAPRGEPLTADEAALEGRLAAFLRQAGDVAGSPCPLCEAPLPLSRRDVLRGAAASACGAGPVDVCARTLSAIPLAEDARTCPACGLRLRDAPDKFPHLGDLAAQCPLCDVRATPS